MGDPNINPDDPLPPIIQLKDESEELRQARVDLVEGRREALNPELAKSSRRRARFHVPQQTKQDKADPEFIKELLERLSEAGFVYPETAENWERIYKGHFENPEKESAQEAESCIDWRGTWLEASVFCLLLGATRLIDNELLWQSTILWFELRCLYHHEHKKNKDISDGIRKSEKSTKKFRAQAIYEILADLAIKNHVSTKDLTETYLDLTKEQ
jgi:hypothetical protein